jgi:hypothetical protein
MRAVTRASILPATFARLALAAFAAVTLSACVTETRPVQRVNAVQATTEIAEAQLLDVGVRLLDPNIPEDEKAQEAQKIFPDVRKAESRYIPMRLRSTLEGSGQWGQVRVVPAEADSLDVIVTGKILESNGMQLKVELTVTDAAGRTWYRKVYEAPADTRSYRDTSGRPRDPFQNLYSEVANDMLVARQKLAAADLETIRRVSDLRFASDLAPYAFKDYLRQDKKGLYQVQRLPAADDPLPARIERIRERDYAFVDTLNEHYALFTENMSEPYQNWRRYSYDELEQESAAKRSALNRKLLGAAAIIAGVVAGANSDTYVGSAAATAGIIGGVYAVKSGFDKASEAKMHSDSLKQLGQSFQSEVQPMVVEVEGRTLQLTGTAEEQFHEWRRLLKELYENETGLAVEAPDAAASTHVQGGQESTVNR